MNNRYRIVIRQSAERDLRNLRDPIREHINAAIRNLAEDPFPQGVKKMHGYEDFYRIRIGRYRVVYSVNKGVLIITVVKVGHRKDAYRRF
ncbi:type II toxin-antitoxin system RelE/ParE family toxin [Candidatus Peregrinibacteria bacterium]|nr:type II toxin-antitoxin system RelE/ParE family toxin [Candidatus Peregrinibacteria bacterium]